MNTQRTQRSGISLFEVLISMLVAAIGVFGVIVLIPFAWETAEKGIDRENAINAAKNYFTDLQAYGYHRSDSWFDDNVNEQKDPASTTNAANQLQPSVADLESTWGMVDTTATGNGIVAGWPYVLDPVGAASRSASVPPVAYGTFPPEPPGLTNSFFDDFLPRLNQINLLESTGFPMPVDMARRIATYQDELVFKAPTDELAGAPRQGYFSVDGIADVKRQYDGRYAMLSFLVPEDDRRQQYKLFTLVGKSGDRDNMRVFQLDPPATGGGDARGYQGLLLGGGDIVLTEEGNTSGAIPLDELPIRNGDWIMLINYNRFDTTFDPTVDPMFDDIQLNFYQVLHSDYDTITGEHNTTLQGPDFDVFRDWDYTTGAPAVATQTVTYAVLIPNVQAVYERSFRVEEASTWTNN